MNPKAVANVHDTVLKLLMNERVGRVLDAAAGEGSLSKKLFDMGFEVYPIDINPTIFQFQQLKCEMIDLNFKLPYLDEIFDIVTSVETIEYLWNPFGCLNEFHRILKIGGKLILTTPNILTVFSRILFLLTGRFAGFLDKDYRKSGHITPIPSWQLERHIKEIGFEAEEITFNRGYIPLIHLGIPFKNLCFGQILIAKFVKNKR